MSDHLKTVTKIDLDPQGHEAEAEVEAKTIILRDLPLDKSKFSWRLKACHTGHTWR